MKNFSILILVFFSFSATYAQVGINADNSAPHSSAQLDVKSTTKAFYPPRMTTAQKNAIVSPQAGAIVFDITLNELSFYNGSVWVVGSGGSGFTLPYSGTSTAANNLLYIENTAPISNFSTIYGKTNSSANTAGIYGLAASTAPSNNTAGVRGQNISANSLGYGVEGIHTGGGTGGYFSSASGFALKTQGKIMFGGSGVGVLGSNKFLKSIDASGTGEWSDILPYNSTLNNSVNDLFKVTNTSTTSQNSIVGSINSSSLAYAIIGYANNSNPVANTSGTVGHNFSSNGLGYGVYGLHSGTGSAVYGTSFNGKGITGNTNSGIGIRGEASANGIGGYFTSASGYALVTDVGNVGIGTLTPTLGGLVVDKAVGNAHAIFGSNTAGVSIESNWPGISFNSYYNAGRKPLSNGFVGGLSMNPINGSLLLYNTAAAGTTGTNILTVERLVINNLGNVGIGNSNPASKLDIQGSVNLSHFYYGSNEDTYIRGGKATSNVIIGDIGNNIGVKTATPFHDLTFKSELGDKISFFDGETSNTANHYGIGIQSAALQFFVPSTSQNLLFGTGRSGAFTERMRISGGGNVGIGMTNATSTLGVIRGTGLNGTAVFYGTNHSSHFNYNIMEDTYIRGGKDNAKVFINDIAGLGQIQIGNAITPAGFKMSVDGKLICTELEVRVTPWPDYVFAKNYNLKPLHELETFIEKNHHLPNIPKAEEIENQSLALGNMAKLQMEKIEELTLYVIEINKRLQKVEEENEKLKNQLNK